MALIIPRGCTCIHKFTIDGIPAASMVKKILITYTQNGKTILEITEASARVSDELPGVIAGLSQHDTLLFSENGNIEVQIRLLLNSDKAIKTSIVAGTADRTLNNEVLA